MRLALRLLRLLLLRRLRPRRLPRFTPDGAWLLARSLAARLGPFTALPVRLLTVGVLTAMVTLLREHGS